MTATGTTSTTSVVFQLLGAELDRDFAALGGLAPFVVVQRVTGGAGSGSRVREEVGRTRPHRGGCRSPSWNEALIGAGPDDFAGSDPGLARFEFSVLGESFGAWAKGRPTFCGAGTASLQELLDGDLKPNEKLAQWSQLARRELVLEKRGARTGVIFVRVQLVKQDSPNAGLENEAESDEEEPRARTPPRRRGVWHRQQRSGCTGLAKTELPERVLESLTRVDPDVFESPVVPLGVSGGTAAFYRLRLRRLDAGRSPDYFVGKDLSRAHDEVLFYEQARTLKKQGGQGFGPLLSFMLEYRGVAACPAEASTPGQPPRTQQLLVMRNLCDGCKRLRMLDLKIGERTADAGWQGKSRAAALKQDVLDGLTTSVVEGYRVEGFDGPPPAFSSMDPLLDFSKFWISHKPDVRKKAHRFMLQRMPPAEILMHLVDVHQEPADPGDAGLAAWRSPTELAELALHEMCCRLAALAVACRRVPAPQKWVGSSVALGFDAGRLPARSAPEAALRREVRVNVFDWGRSELNPASRHASLPEEERRDRAAFWRYYVGGVDRLAWAAARCYHHRFGCSAEVGWASLQVAIYDFDSSSANDFIGEAELELPIAPAPAGGEDGDGEEATVGLLDQHGRPVRSIWGPPATLSFKIRHRSLPGGSRLTGAWRVTLVRAAHLPARDHLTSTSDPFAVLTAGSRDGRLRFRQQTRVLERELNPQWDETFELPLVKDSAALEKGLDASAPGVGPMLDELLLKEEASHAEVDKALASWSCCLDKANELMLQARADLGRAMLQSALDEQQQQQQRPQQAPEGCASPAALPDRSAAAAAAGPGAPVTRYRL